MSKLLFDESPLVIQPKLALAVGLNEAIVLQQLHYWIGKESGKVIDGVRWIYNSGDDWQKQFPFWSRSTIVRAFDSLEQQEIVKTGNFNRLGYDRTKWYTIDYRRLDVVCEQSIVQNEQSIVSNCDNGLCQNEPTIPETSPESSPETTTTRETPVLSSLLDEKEDPEKCALAIREYQRVVSFSMSPTMAETIRTFVQDIPLECIKYAFDQAEFYNKKSWAYVTGILDNLRAARWVITPKKNGNGNGHGPPVEFRHEAWLTPQLKPGETLEACLARLIDAGDVPKGARVRRRGET